jgi:hypothetical protein
VTTNERMISDDAKRWLNAEFSNDAGKQVTDD